MKPSTFFKVFAIALPLMLASCKSKKNVADNRGGEIAILSKDSLEQKKYLQNVMKNKLEVNDITSKIKFTVEVGEQNISLTGNLRMKRDDVIQLQLMAFGFVEAARLEFTNDYALVVDRINKKYIKAPYSKVDFLRENKLDFYALQSLFWNELFIPGEKSLDDGSLSLFTLKDLGNGETVLKLNKTFKNKKKSSNKKTYYAETSYQWLSNMQEKTVGMANMNYADSVSGDSKLVWDYSEFKPFAGKLFPAKQRVDIITPSRSIMVNMTISHLKEDSKWEPRTKVSDKYREMSIDEILVRFMAL